MIVATGRLHEFIAGAWAPFGVPEQDAVTVALSYTQAELEGQSGLGALRLPFLRPCEKWSRLTRRSRSACPATAHREADQRRQAGIELAAELVAELEG